MDLQYPTLFLERQGPSADKSTTDKPGASRLKKLFSRVLNAPSKDSLALNSSSSSVGTSKSKPKNLKQDQQIRSAQHAEHLWDTVVKLTKPVSKMSFGSAKAQTVAVNSQPPLRPVGGNQTRNNKSTKLSQSIRISPPASISNSPTSTSVPSSKQNDTFYKGKGKPIASSRDSKFSSISSLPSLHTLGISTCTTETNTVASSPTTSLALSTISAHITLSRSEFSQIQSQLRRIHKRLLYQGHVTGNLAANLLSLLIRKETLIQNESHNHHHAKSSTYMHTKVRHHSAHTQNMLSTLLTIRDQLGRIFSRKEAFLSHSVTELGIFRKVLQDIERVAVEGIPEVGSSKMAEEVQFVLAREDIISFLTELDKGSGVQKRLDAEALKVVRDRAGEERWVKKGGIGDRVTMGRFIGFVESRIEVLGGVYESLEGYMEGVGNLCDKSEGVSAF
ncbi:uncharacterized protein RAG0_09492 [Rhynchosporium agropyri]|uniref:Uncharacterized protein n=1 Tax=Rhynchosporium agropyri TaxID=914238 RepID=A0A1E1KVR5_9HELO|nr:uncharacterized protein RAG0_09492 [Rhynchosporium agropyri]